MNDKQKADIVAIVNLQGMFVQMDKICKQYQMCEDCPLHHAAIENGMCINDYLHYKYDEI